MFGQLILNYGGVKCVFPVVGCTDGSIDYDAIAEEAQRQLDQMGLHPNVVPIEMAALVLKRVHTEHVLGAKLQDDD